MNTTVIGIGNRDRADDAIGLVAIDRLADDPPPGVRLETAHGDVLEVLELFDGAAHVILIDAMQAELAPGALLRLDASRPGSLPQLDSFASSHAINLAQAIELARALGRLPPRLIIFGVQAVDFTPGNALSAPCAAALDTLIDSVRKECACTKPH